jgi:GNAT superfamily N-acetyltransferase
MSAAPGPVDSARYLVRPARDSDVDAIVGYEIDIAVVSFAEEAVTDPALHRKRVTGALGKPGEVTLVAVDPLAPGRPLGWAWLSARTNSLTGDRYGNFRSLATADVPDRSLIGKVHAGNLGMRALYRKFGFTAAHLTMERKNRPPAADVAGEPR